MFTKNDIQQFRTKGIELSTIEKQIENFKNGFPFIELINPATKENGLKSFNSEEINAHVNFYKDAYKGRDVLKFVPASGAASRMFKHLFEFNKKYKNSDIDFADFSSDKGFNSVYNFFDKIQNFAFYDELKKSMQKDELDIEKCIAEKKFTIVIDYLLNEKGLNYAALPKGLLKFHNYENHSRMSIEEHLVEGANYAKNNNGIVKIHFTLSPEHKEEFVEKIKKVKGKYEEKFDVVYNISYSEQKPSTDTIAVDMDNNVFRENDGQILFRPGGHGALIENLNEINTDIIFIKNIDNIVTDKLSEETYIYKKVAVSYLIKLQDEIFRHLKTLEGGNITNKELDKIIDFTKNELNINCNFSDYKKPKKIDVLFNKLNRPIRICGMVKNVGEPGGGPFWVKNSDGFVSLQIIESSQIDLNNIQQKEIVNNATHFNPVDLVCGVKNYKGKNFNLHDFVDHSTGFISEKFKDGKKLKAQELPGLWNGAMANWITIFVEVPIITFNPVKTINDLLREQHQ